MHFTLKLPRVLRFLSSKFILLMSLKVGGVFAILNSKRNFIHNFQVFYEFLYEHITFNEIELRCLNSI